MAEIINQRNFNRTDNTHRLLFGWGGERPHTLDPRCLGRLSYWFDILLGNANAISGEVKNPVEIAAAPTTHDSSVSRRVSTSTSRLWSLKAATLSLLIRERPENATVDEMLARAIAATRFMVQ